MTYATEWKGKNWEVQTPATGNPAAGDTLLFQGQGKDTSPGSVDRQRDVTTTSAWATACKHQTTGADRVHLIQGGKPFTVFRNASRLECWEGHLTASPSSDSDEPNSGASWTAQEGGTRA